MLNREGKLEFMLHLLEKKSLQGGSGSDLNFATRGHIITLDSSSSN